MKKKTNITGKTMKKIVSHMAEPMTEWPPTCLFIVYQPKRPVKRNDNMSRNK